MNNEPQDQTSSEPKAADMSALSLDFNMVPEWARQPPAPDRFKQADRVDERRERPARRDRDDRGDRRPVRPPVRREGFRDGPARGGRPGGNEPDARPRPERGPNERPAFRDRPAPYENIPVQISFIPSQEMLTSIVADLRASRKAYPLPQVAARFLTHPAGYQVKVEMQKDRDGQRALRLYQCADTGFLFLNRDEAITHVVRTQLEGVFRKEDLVAEPPSGQFVCVAQCSLSGELLGPPNHHGYNERVDELHRSRFAHMSADAYRRQIVTLRDPEKIEQWKDQWRRKTVYHRIGAEEGTEPVTERDAREWFLEHEAPKRVKEAARFIVPSTVAQSTIDEKLLRVMRQAWAREHRFPISLLRALRGAFRRMGMNVFHRDPQSEFVSALSTKPLEDTEHVVQNIRDALNWIQTHSGCTRQMLVEGVWPSMMNDPVQAAHALQPLAWLVDKGHVVEFYDGTLWVPGHQEVKTPPPVADAPDQDTPA